MRCGFFRSEGKFYTYQIILAIDGTKICMKSGVETIAKGVLASPGGSTYLAMWNCVPLVIWLGVHCGVVAVVHFLRWKAGVSGGTSSQMWGSWNFPRLLLRGGSFTLMNIASLIVLVMLCAFVPTREKLSHTDAMPCGVAMFVYGTWALRCSLSLSQLTNVLLLTACLGTF